MLSNWMEAGEAVRLLKRRFGHLATYVLVKYIRTRQVPVLEWCFRDQDNSDFRQLPDSRCVNDPRCLRWRIENGSKLIADDGNRVIIGHCGLLVSRKHIGAQLRGTAKPVRADAIKKSMGGRPPRLPEAGMLLRQFFPTARTKADVFQVVKGVADIHRKAVAYYKRHRLAGEPPSPDTFTRALDLPPSHKSFFGRLPQK